MTLIILLLDNCFISAILPECFIEDFQQEPPAAQ